MFDTVLYTACFKGFSCPWGMYCLHIELKYSCIGGEAIMSDTAGGSGETKTKSRDILEMSNSKKSPEADLIAVAGLCRAEKLLCAIHSGSPSLIDVSTYSLVNIYV